jgi:predicted HicB family RNase H-like nuclease
MMAYEGYRGRVEFDDEAGLFQARSTGPGT